jgi:hypothetical protein
MEKVERIAEEAAQRKTREFITGPSITIFKHPGCSSLTGIAQVAIGKKSIKAECEACGHRVPIDWAGEHQLSTPSFIL